MRIPAALSEADAHLGLANRLALRRSRSGSSSPIRSRASTSRATASSAGRSRRAPARSRQSEAREIFELPPEGRALLVAGALAGARSLNEMAIEAFGEVGPPILHISGERDYWSLKSRAARATTTG